MGPAVGVTVSGNHASGVFQVNSGVTASMSGLTITGGNITSSNGAGVDNFGVLTLTNSVVSGNTTTNEGGGISNEASATTTLIDLHGERELGHQRRRSDQPGRHDHAE